MTPGVPDSIRYIPQDWLNPVDFMHVFGNERPLEADIGCGKGRFLLARAAAHPQTNFVGIDRKLRRIRKLDSKARRSGLENIRLMRIDAYYAVTCLIPAASLSAVYLFFPDPWPKARHQHHRLFNEQFQNALHRIMRPEAPLHFASDHQPYFEEVRELLRADTRFEEIEALEPEPSQKTDFELRFMEQKPIGRMSCVRVR